MAKTGLSMNGKKRENGSKKQNKTSNSSGGLSLLSCFSLLSVVGSALQRVAVNGRACEGTDRYTTTKKGILGKQQNNQKRKIARNRIYLWQ